MAMSMGPPQLPGYSLRVQLFSPNAYDSTDKPIRCFRVVVSPDVSIREFCEEASRIHEINYGEPLAIKKCQDDQQFDITQSEILGNLFANTATIRVIKASPGAGIRDSVPPSSALRFTPPSLKRDRQTSPQVNGITPSSSYKPNKRQRLESLDPDHPIPSREGGAAQGEPRTINGRVPDVNVVPSSQESVIRGTDYRVPNTSRQVRPDLPQIPETPSPSPPPPALNVQQSSYERHETNQYDRKAAVSANASNRINEARNSSPFKQTSVRNDVNQPRAKSSSYHIQRATERGTSVSTAATSPLSTDQQPTRNAILPPPKRKISDSSSGSSRFNAKVANSLNEDAIYENIVSDDDSVAILSAKKAVLKIRKSPNAGLPGMEWANGRVSTPPNGRRSTSRDQATVTTPRELPLTPSSKERESQRQKREADEARKARLAAAEAAELRKREAKEAQVAEEQRRAEEDRARREEQERIEIEDFRRGEAERAAKAARSQKEKEEREKREAEKRQREEDRRKEEKRIEEERKKEEERLRREKTAKQRQDAERLRQNKALLAEATQKREEKEMAQAQKAAGDAEKANGKSSTPVQARNLSPAIGTPGSIRRSPSSTPFIPNGRKSALKQPGHSSQAVATSPAPSSRSPEIGREGVGIEAQMPLPKDRSRRVSFEEPPKRETAIKPPERKILPPPKPSTPVPVPKAVARVEPKTPGSSGKTSTTPIPPPASNRRSTTPMAPPKSTQPLKEAASQVAPKDQSHSQEKKPKISPPTIPAARKSATPVQPPAKAKSHPVEPAPKTQIITISSSDEEDAASDTAPSGPPERKSKSPREAALNSETDSEAESDSEGNKAKKDHRQAVDGPKGAPKSTAQETTRRSGSEDGDGEEETDDDSDEAASNPSSVRDSRSPVIFGQHTGPLDASNSKPSVSTESESGSDDEDEEESDESDGGNVLEKEAEEAEESNDEESDEEMTQAQVPGSSPTLPAHKAAARPPMQQKANSKSHTDDGDTSTSTQGEIDQQLTSSVYEARHSPPSSPPKRVPSSSLARPALKVGASLQALHSKRSLKEPEAPKPVNGLQASSQRRGLKEASSSEEDSEEESDDDTSSEEEGESENDNATARQLSSALSRSPNHKINSRPTDSDSDETATTSDSDAESEDEVTQMRNELAAQISGVANSQNDTQQSGITIPGPKPVKKAGEAKKQDKHTRYIRRYSFSQPGL